MVVFSGELAARAVGDVAALGACGRQALGRCRMRMWRMVVFSGEFLWGGADYGMLWVQRRCFKLRPAHQRLSFLPHAPAE